MSSDRPVGAPSEQSVDTMRARLRRRISRQLAVDRDVREPPPITLPKVSALTDGVEAGDNSFCCDLEC